MQGERVNNVKGAWGVSPIDAASPQISLLLSSAVNWHRVRVDRFQEDCERPAASDASALSPSLAGDLAPSWPAGTAALLQESRAAFRLPTWRGPSESPWVPLPGKWQFVQWGCPVVPQGKTSVGCCSPKSPCCKLCRQFIPPEDMVAGGCQPLLTWGYTSKFLPLPIGRGKE